MKKILIANVLLVGIVNGISLTIPVLGAYSEGIGEDKFRAVSDDWKSRITFTMEKEHMDSFVDRGDGIYVYCGRVGCNRADAIEKLTNSKKPERPLVDISIDSEDQELRTKTALILNVVKQILDQSKDISKDIKLIKSILTACQTTCKTKELQQIATNILINFEASYRISAKKPNISINQEESKNNTKNDSKKETKKLTSFQQEVLKLVNQERAKVGVKPLTYDIGLEEVAQYHVDDMLNKDFFSHTSLDGSSPWDRCERFGVACDGENIALGYDTPIDFMNGWMNSSGHRANVLNSSFTELGVGFAEGKGMTNSFFTKRYAVQVFKKSNSQTKTQIRDRIQAQIQNQIQTQDKERIDPFYHDTISFDSLFTGTSNKLLPDEKIKYMGFTEGELNYILNASLTLKEQELFDLMNQYRNEKGLPAITLNMELTKVARTHVIDILKNSSDNQVDGRGIKGNLHSRSISPYWQGGAYTSDHKYASIMWNKPRELTIFTGNGYEISHGFGGKDGLQYHTTPYNALEGWKGSSGHNAVVVGQGSRSDLTMAGIAIEGGYACIWFSR